MWTESSLNDLYRSAVQAFPRTRRRQHATDPIRITHLEWTPFIGMRTLFLKGLAQNTEEDGGEYEPIILFKNVRYHTTPQPGLVEIMASDNRIYYLEQLNAGRSDVLLRCGCGDYFWRFNYYNSTDRSLYGRARTPYQGEYRINPMEMPGMCKHLMKMGTSLRDAGLVTDMAFNR
jgi:hypothetical protein